MLNRFKSLSKLFTPFSTTSRSSYRFSTDQENEKPAPKTQKVPKSKISQPPRNLRNVALVLSGSGVYDGSEITETVSFMIALSARKIRFQCYAPNKDQTEVVDHLTGQTIDEKRNILVESARIARGKVKDIKELVPKGYDALFFPGGFGAAKNLSSFATEGSKFTVDPEVERVIKEFHENRKPIGLACISPVLAAKVLGSDRKLSVTVGDKGEEWPYNNTIDAIEELGCKHVSKSVTQSHMDIRSLVFTTPAFMKETSDFSEIYESIDNLVGTIQKRLKGRHGSEEEQKKNEKAKKSQQNKDEENGEEGEAGEGMSRSD